MPVIDQRGRVRCFVADLSLFQVQLVSRDGVEYALGLPLIRPGTWNGVPYTADDMRAIAANFEVIRSVEGTEPPLRPQHAYDPQTGEPIVTDATETHAWFNALRYDEAQQVLFGDARLVDWECGDGIRSGVLRYLSTEIMPQYTLNDPKTGEMREIGPALVGTAWVDNPAVKGLGFEVLLNAQGFGTLRPTGGNRAASAARRDDGAQAPNAHRAGPGNEGVRCMSWFEKLRGVLIGMGAKEEDLAELTDGAPPEAPATNQAAPPAADPASDEMAKLKAENAGLKTQLDELRAGLATVTANAAAEKIGLRVDELVRGGYVPPAERETVVNMAVSLDASGSKVMVNAAGTPQERKTVDVYLEGLRARGPQVKTHAAGVNWTGSEDPDAQEPMTDEQLEAVANAAR